MILINNFLRVQVMVTLRHGPCWANWRPYCTPSWACHYSCCTYPTSVIFWPKALNGSTPSAACAGAAKSVGSACWLFSGRNSGRWEACLETARFFWFSVIETIPLNTFLSIHLYHPPLFPVILSVESFPRPLSSSLPNVIVAFPVISYRPDSFQLLFWLYAQLSYGTAHVNLFLITFTIFGL